ncbi:MAG: phosphoribosylanthranilate isomerase [Rickettsiales bacterium]
MASKIEIKICGITDERGMKAATRAGADYIGFIFVKDSPRYIAPKEAATLTQQFREHLRPEGRKIVAVMADPTDQDLAEVLTDLSPDVLQLHGKESPDRVRDIAGIYDIRMVKALGIASKADIRKAEDYVGYADMLLFDAKTKDGRSGGTGESFDWNLLKEADISLPWFLSGGLDEANIANAIAQTGAGKVDVSSGVESTKGVKDPEKIEAFIEKVRQISGEAEEDAHDYDD